MNPESTSQVHRSPSLAEALPAEPISRTFGFDRGTPIDRHYIEAFLARHSMEILGRVLEVGDSTYTFRYGQDRVTRSDVLHAVPGNSKATIVADLGATGSLPASSFDCIILTQTLGCIFNVHAAVANGHQALRPGGALLATVPGISQISRYDMDRWGDYWRFTTRSARRLFAEAFGAEQVCVEAHGNVRSASAFLYGLPAEALSAGDLSRNDPDYELLITIRAVRRA